MAKFVQTISGSKWINIETVSFIQLTQIMVDTHWAGESKQEPFLRPRCFMDNGEDYVLNLTFKDSQEFQEFLDSEGFGLTKPIPQIILGLEDNDTGQ